MGDNKIKTVAISGASGFIGSYLTCYFLSEGFDVMPLRRRHFTDAGAGELNDIIGRADVVINLAGAPINHRWTANYKAELYDSRINTTRRLVKAISEAENKPGLFCSASAVGYYSPDPQKCHTEYDFEKGSDFLSGLCEAWENQAMNASDHVRTVIMRFGLVLSPLGGVMKMLRLPTRFKFAAILGRGDQYFPWIDIEDLAGAIDFIIRSESLYGAFNFTAPQHVTNSDFTHALARYERSLLTVKIPPFVFKTALGEAASFVLSGQCASPKRLLEAGYGFRSPDILTFFQNNIV